MIDKIEKVKKIKKIASDVVCEFYGIDIHKNSRRRDYVMGRAMYYKILRDNTRMSLETIADTFGKHHATAIHSIKQLQGFMSYDYSLNADYLEINNQFVNLLDKSLLTLISESSSAEVTTPKYLRLLDKYNHLKESYNNLKKAHNQIIVSTSEVNKKYKKIKVRFEQREDYYNRNGYILE
jgi:hypothetical protein